MGNIIKFDYKKIITAAEGPYLKKYKGWAYLSNREYQFEIYQMVELNNNDRFDK
ncbi:unnamed protein product [Paramecium sonneborni]|uniref:Uncharacterized protein n=1 Tax=Paramecium sonneborni TaxID=65129 RepID=A0A8S1PJ88_9CILI|nr:unnamed protein product [Paramecium sonneborni]